MFSRISSAMSYLLPSSYSKTAAPIADEKRVKETGSICGFVIVDELKDDIQEAVPSPMELIRSLSLSDKSKKSLSMIIDLISNCLKYNKEVKPEVIQVLASLLSRDLNLDPAVNAKEIIRGMAYFMVPCNRTFAQSTLEIKKHLGLQENQENPKHKDQVILVVKWNLMIRKLNQDSNLIDVDLAEMDLSNLDFSNLNMRFCHLQNSKLDGTKLEGADLFGAKRI